MTRATRRLDLNQIGLMLPTTMLAAAIDKFGPPSVLKRLRRGTTVLVFGAPGAVGTMAVQMAKRKGATVIATASGPEATRIVRRLGADLVVDGRSKSSVDRVRKAAPRGLNAVLALAGGKDLEQFLALMTRPGRIVYPNGIEPVPKRRAGITIRGFDVVADPKHLREFREFVTGGEVRVPIAATYPLSQAGGASRPAALSCFQRFLLMSDHLLVPLRGVTLIE